MLDSLLNTEDLMSKKHFIALADLIREHNRLAGTGGPYTAFTEDQITALAEFCRDQNYGFMRDRWMSYIAGECGPNGGSIRV